MVEHERSLLHKLSPVHGMHSRAGMRNHLAACPAMLQAGHRAGRTAGVKQYDCP